VHITAIPTYSIPTPPQRGQTRRPLLSLRWKGFSREDRRDLRKGPAQRWAERWAESFRPSPAIGRPLSSQMVRPSQVQICLGFWKRPAERAMMPQANLWKDVWLALALHWAPQVPHPLQAQHSLLLRVVLLTSPQSSR
jgi:hypothetical protein